jgi:aspartate ammonia-lyase
LGAVSFEINMSVAVRTERDLLGERPVCAHALHGIHTLRAVENFPLSMRPVHPQLISAYGTVKLACARTNRSIGAWHDRPAKADAIELACQQMRDGLLDEHILVDALQGGAGTSTNMNVNEVLANRAAAILGDAVDPIDDLNLHQSTNDTYPTALKLAAIRLLSTLESAVLELQEAFQGAEQRFADVVKVGRTQLQDAVLMTLGREMSAYAEAFNRDRWRIYKCQERLRIVNLGGTAIGTGLGAPRDYIFRVVDELRELTGIGFARGENLIDTTQNCDVFAEVSGIVRAHAVSLIKVCNDLRLLSSGPDAGLGELILPARQAGSSIMPGKINPVIPEAVIQAAMRVMGLDATIAAASAAGNLELNPFLPLIADCMLESLDLLARADVILDRHCVRGLEANVERCEQHVHGSIALATALVPAIGYQRACDALEGSRSTGKSLREVLVGGKILSATTFDALITPEVVCRLGSPTPTTGQLHNCPIEPSPGTGISRSAANPGRPGPARKNGETPAEGETS